MPKYCNCRHKKIKLITNTIHHIYVINNIFHFICANCNKPIKITYCNCKDWSYHIGGSLLGVTNKKNNHLFKLYDYIVCSKCGGRLKV